MDVDLLRSNSNWELMWAPYDQPTYDIVLQAIRADDCVLEIGAGDLRLARQMAPIARRVLAIEIHSDIIGRALSKPSLGLPLNLTVVCGDALRLPFPSDISVGVLLMRHCTHFKQFAAKLKDAGCRRLITNARWRMGVEVIDLHAERVPFEAVKMGWYACWCGAAGFIPGPAEELTPAVFEYVHEVSSCPSCAD